MLQAEVAAVDRRRHHARWVGQLERRVPILLGDSGQAAEWQVLAVVGLAALDKSKA